MRTGLRVLLITATVVLLAWAFRAFLSPEGSVDQCAVAEAARSLPSTFRLGEIRRVLDQSDVDEWPGLRTYTWQKFSARPQRGDCVIAFENITDAHAPLNGDAKGFLLIRHGKVIDDVVAEIQ